MRQSFLKSAVVSARSRRALVIATGLAALLLSLSTSTRAQESNKAAEALSKALEPVSCRNVADVARLYEAYEHSLGTSKPSTALIAKAAQRLAVCLPTAVSNATKACLAQLPPGDISIGFLGAGATSPRELVQATNSLVFFARDVSRNGSSEIQALAAKYKVTQASALLEQRAFVIKRSMVPDADETRAQELRQKPKESLTQDDRALLEKSRGWNDPL